MHDSAAPTLFLEPAVVALVVVFGTGTAPGAHKDNFPVPVRVDILTLTFIYSTHAHTRTHVRRREQVYVIARAHMYVCARVFILTSHLAVHTIQGYDRLHYMCMHARARRHIHVCTNASFEGF